MSGIIKQKIILKVLFLLKRYLELRRKIEGIFSFYFSPHLFQKEREKQKPEKGNKYLFHDPSFLLKGINIYLTLPLI